MCLYVLSSTGLHELAHMHADRHCALILTQKLQHYAIIYAKDSETNSIANAPDCVWAFAEDAEALTYATHVCSVAPLTTAIMLSPHSSAHAGPCTLCNLHNDVPEEIQAKLM